MRSILERRGGTLRPVDEMLLHSEPIANGWNVLLGAIREENTLPSKVFEIVVLRVAALNGAPYEWRAHEDLARRAGLSSQQIEALRDGSPLRSFDARERAVLDLVDAMTQHVTVPENVFVEARRFFDERQMLELVGTVAAYNMVTRFVVALDL